MDLCRYIHDHKLLHPFPLSKLHELKEEAWKLQLYGELESLKRQLASLQGLEKDLDAAEAMLDATEPGTYSG